MRVTIRLLGNDDRYLGIYHVLFDDYLVLVTGSEKDVEEKLAGVEYTEMAFETSHAMPIQKPTTWIDKFMGKRPEYDFADRTARRLVIPMPRFVSQQAISGNH
jgi:hypothetical protein